MGDITKNFSKKEFACKCGCGTFNLDNRIPQMLEILKTNVNKYLNVGAIHELPLPIIVMSACRCDRHNAAVGGTKNSYHIAENQGTKAQRHKGTKEKICKAVDITVSGLKMSELMYIVEAHCNASLLQAKLPFWTGRGIYLAKNIIHLDIGERDKIINPQSTIRQKSPIANRKSKIVRWIDISKRGYKYVSNFNELYKVDGIV